MKAGVGILVLAACAALLTAPAIASELFIYPNEGQSNEQMEKDKYECYSWAKQQTGFDPMQKPTASSPPPEQTTSGGAVSGAARGAALGAIGGAIADASVQLIEDPKVGDFVLLHTGFAIEKISPEEAAENMRYLEELRKVSEEMDKQEGDEG